MKPINIIKIWIVVCSLAIFGVFMQGCVADDLSVCGIALRFKYTKNSDGIDKFSSSINKINLYIFNEDSVLVNEFEYEESRFADNYSVFLNIPPGKYHIVAWGNVRDNYEIGSANPNSNQYLTQMGEYLLRYKHTKDTIIDTPSDLYYGSLDATITSNDLQLKNKDFIIDMMKDTKYIIVKARGLAINETRAAGTMYDCLISSNNGLLRFDNNKIGDERLQYIPTYEIKTEVDEEGESKPVLISNFTLVREQANGETAPRLIFTRNEHGVISKMFDKDIYPLLLAAAQRAHLDFDYKDTFEIELIFDDTYQTVGLIVDGWIENLIEEPVGWY